MRRALAICVLLLGTLPACKEAASTAVPKLIKQLNAKESSQRNEAAQSLARYGTEAQPATQALVRALWDDNLGVRSSAAYALGKIGTPAASAAIENYKKEKAKQIKEGQE